MSQCCFMQERDDFVRQDEADGGRRRRDAQRRRLRRRRSDQLQGVRQHVHRVRRFSIGQRQLENWRKIVSGLQGGPSGRGQPFVDIAKRVALK